MIGHREADIGQPVKAKLAIGLGIIDRLVGAGLFGRLGIGLAVFERAKKAEAQRVGPHVDPAQHQAGQKAVFRPERLDIAHLLQILADRTGPHLGFIFTKLVTRPTTFDGGMGGFGSGLTAKHRVVIALDARHVDHAHRTPQKCHAGRHHLGHRLETTFRDRPCTIGHAFTALQQLRHHRVVLETLEFHVGEKMRVAVVQVHHEANVNLIVLKVIDKGPTTGIAAQRPAHRVGYRAFLVLGRVDLPDLFHTEAEFLRLLAL